MAAPQTFLRQRNVADSHENEEKSKPDEVVSSPPKRDEVVWGKTPSGEGQWSHNFG
jgi:hypothetical protein